MHYLNVPRNRIKCMGLWRIFCKNTIRTKLILLMPTSHDSSPAKYHVYVIELHRRVWSEHHKLRAANPQYRGIMGCLYVGVTAHTPQERFSKHKSGYRTKKGVKISASIVEKYGLYLRPSLYAPLNPLTKSRAYHIEQQLALSLRKRGYAVWWN